MADLLEHGEVTISAIDKVEDFVVGVAFGKTLRSSGV